MPKLLHLSVIAIGALLVAGCGGASDDDADLEVNDVGTVQAAFAVSDTTGDGADSTGEVGDPSCREEDDLVEHARHHRHKFKVLDMLDGVRDHQVTLANLPPGLSAALVAKLHAIDENGDGIVLKPEVKAFRKAEKRAAKLAAKEAEQGP